MFISGGYLRSIWEPETKNRALVKLILMCLNMSNTQYGAWGGRNFLLLFSVSQDFGISWCRHISPAQTTIYSQWIEVWIGGGWVILFNEISTRSCNHCCIFFLLCERVQNPAKNTTHLRLWIQFPSEVVRHSLIWLGRPHHSFLYRHHKKWI